MSSTPANHDASLTPVVITIDGPAGAGKSTAARRLATELGFDFLDTGAMYRAVARACLQAGADVTDAGAVDSVAARVQIAAAPDGVVVDGHLWSHELRTAEVTAAASYVASYAEIRRRLVELQRRAAHNKRIVSEGRDQGTVVFPDAACKFFLTAGPVHRARRRLEDLARQGKSATLDEILAQQVERDRRDETRAVAPLRPAADAIQLDTSDLTEGEVVARLKQIIHDRLTSC